MSTVVSGFSQISTGVLSGFKKKSVRAYFINEDKTFAEFFWFEEHKPFDFFMGINGLRGGASTLLCQYQDEEIEGESLVFHRTFRYSEAKTINKPFDHFSFHPDGKFWLKLRVRDGAERYIHRMQFSHPIADIMQAYQDVMIMSDLRSKYCSRITQPKKNNLKISIPQNSVMTVRIRLSGIKYDLEDEVKKNDGIVGSLSKQYFSWSGTTLKAILRFEPMVISDLSVFEKRPSGTVVGFLLPPLRLSNPTKRLTKAFHFV